MKTNPDSAPEAPRSVTFPCIRASQPIGDLFFGSINHAALCEIAYFDVRRVLQEERDVERYLGIQRPLNDRRVKQLENYVNYRDATFPTAIILAVEERCAVYDDTHKTMTLSNFPSDDKEQQVSYGNIARVIDGQHRIAGLFEFKGDQFEVNVTVFVGMDVSDQAYVFSTVNLEQTKVNKSLAYDLFALARTRSPQKTCHNIAVALDQDSTSPFYKRIKRLGTATPERVAETITQATFVEALQKYISADPKKDRDLLLRGKKPEKVHGAELDKLPLRNLFVEEKDLDIAQIMWNYFDAIRRRWPQAWEERGRGYILNKTNGFRAFMRVFGKAYLFNGAPGDVVQSSKFYELLSRSTLRDGDFTVERFQPGTGGESSLVHSLVADLRLD